jgi:hypothetical protein
VDSSDGSARGKGQRPESSFSNDIRLSGTAGQVAR